MLGVSGTDKIRQINTDNKDPYETNPITLPRLASADATPLSLSDFRGVKGIL